MTTARKVKQRRRSRARDLRTRGIAFLVSRSELAAIEEAASDAHLTVAEYVRLMALAAAGMGGVVEHLERAIDASALVEVR
jgi:pseudouridine-5'-phosphate glycosidase